MARKPDNKIRSKRTRTIILDERAYDLYTKLRSNNSKWNFSDWVCSRLKEHFLQDPEERIKTEIHYLKKEKEFVVNQLEAQLRFHIKQLESVVGAKIDMKGCENEQGLIKDETSLSA